jgi:hypothetical protein
VNGKEGPELREGKLNLRVSAPETEEVRREYVTSHN